MTILELNALPYMTANIERILRHLESDSMDPGWFISRETKSTAPDPIRRVLQQELPELMAEYRRLTAYINSITDSYMKRIFEMRFIEQKSLREIGVLYGLSSGTLKQQIYSYVRLNPEGYYSCKELAELWGLNINTVNNWCRKGLLPGAKKRGLQRWIIPRDVTRPQNRRYQNNQKSSCG